MRPRQVRRDPPWFVTVRQVVRRAVQDARGSGTVIAAGIIGALLVLTAGMLTALTVVAAHTRASVAADAAALAAANTASGRVAGDPCANAALVAAEHDVSLTACDSTLLESTISVEVHVGVFQFDAAARAGQPSGAFGVDME